jgi:hypothetical protein
MRNKIWAALAAFAAMSLAVFGFAAPAMATGGPYMNCAYLNVCLFQNINYNANQWHSSIANIDLHTNECLTIPPAQYADGNNVSDGSSSLVVNSDTANGNPWQYYTIYFFNWINCNSDGGVRAFPMTAITHIPSLYSWSYYNVPSISMARTITSIEVIPNSFAPKNGVPTS